VKADNLTNSNKTPLRDGEDSRFSQQTEEIKVHGNLGEEAIGN